MIEIRWFWIDGNKTLQYRYRMHCPSNIAINEWPWSEWKNVEHVHFEVMETK
jgi:hypothetical protein